MARKKRNTEVLWRREKDLAEDPGEYAGGRVWGEPDWIFEGKPKRDVDMPPADYVFTTHGDPKVGKTTWTPPVRSEWTTGDVPRDLEATACSWSCKKNPHTPIISIDKTTTEAIIWLMENKNVEWQMLLTGKVCEFPDEGDVVLIDGYYIPKQRVSGATVDNIDCIDKKLIEEKKIICTIHSHVEMAAFFSSRDVTECNMGPIKYHIVMNNKYEYQSVKQVKLPCGMLNFVKCEVMLYEPKAVQPEGTDNITGGYRYGGSAEVA